MTAELLNQINANFRDMITSNIQTNLYKLSAEQFDAIKTIRMTEEDKRVLDMYVIQIDFNHPKDYNKIISFYWCGGEIFKIVTKP